MKFQVFHVNPGEKLMKKDDNNKLSHSLINFPNIYLCKVFTQQSESDLFRYAVVRITMLLLILIPNKILQT